MTILDGNLGRSPGVKGQLLLVSPLTIQMVLGVFYCAGILGLRR